MPSTTPARRTIALSAQLDKWLHNEAIRTHRTGKAAVFEHLLDTHVMATRLTVADVRRLEQEMRARRATYHKRRIELSEAGNRLLDQIQATIPVHLRPDRNLAAAWIILCHQNRVVRLANQPAAAQAYYVDLPRELVWWLDEEAYETKLLRDRIMQAALAELPDPGDWDQLMVRASRDYEARYGRAPMPPRGATRRVFILPETRDSLRRLAKESRRGQSEVAATALLLAALDPKGDVPAADAIAL